MRLSLFLLVGALTMGGMWVSAEPGSTTSEEIVLFTSNQVEEGVVPYRSECSSCHGIRLGGGMGPALEGEAFLRQWGSKTVAALDEYIRTEMPLGTPGSLDSSTYDAILAYILSENGHEAGGTEPAEKVQVDPSLN